MTPTRSGSPSSGAFDVEFNLLDSTVHAHDSNDKSALLKPPVRKRLMGTWLRKRDSFCSAAVKRKSRLRPQKRASKLFPNPSRREYSIHFETDDFTSLCPVTGQADFARVEIDYRPNRVCIESKSLKFYLASYRSVRAFNEAVTNRILDDFVKACAPHTAIVTARFSARGGIALSVRAEYSNKKSVASKR